MISVRIARSDSGYGAPEIEVVFSLKSGDEPVGHSDVDQREETCGFPIVQAPGFRDDAGDSAPSEDGTFIPEASDGCLFGGPSDAVLLADGFHLVVVPCV